MILAGCFFGKDGILAAKRICQLSSGAAIYAEALTIRLRQILSSKVKAGCTFNGGHKSLCPTSQLQAPAMRRVQKLSGSFRERSEGRTRLYQS